MQQKQRNQACHCSHHPDTSLGVPKGTLETKKKKTPKICYIDIENHWYPLLGWTTWHQCPIQCPVCWQCLAASPPLFPAFSEWRPKKFARKSHRVARPTLVNGGWESKRISKSLLPSMAPLIPPLANLTMCMLKKHNRTKHWKLTECENIVLQLCLQRLLFVAKCPSQPNRPD